MLRERPKQLPKRSNNKSLADGAPFRPQERRVDPPFEELDIAVRSYAEQTKTGNQKTRRSPGRPSPWVLIFDTETTTDASQRFRFGSYQVRDHDELAEHGIFYVEDDPGALTATDIEIIRRYARKHHLKLLTVREFVDDIFYDVGYHFRASIVAFNLPFDISRLAIEHNDARAGSFTPRDSPEITKPNRSMVGGFTFKLSEHARPNVRIKHRSAKDAFFQFTNLVKGGRSRRGYFVDVKTIASAILGGSFSLERLANELQVEHRKLRASKHGGPITPQYLEYAVRDVVATWECYRTLRDRYQGYALTETPLHTLHSEATIGKAHLKQMGIKPWFETQPDFPHELLGAIMCAYFGGRSEVHIRRQVTRVLYCDFLSMYPTVSTLMGLWSFVRATGVSWTDATDEITSLLDRITLADLQRPEFWPLLTCLVQVRPDGDIFPVRAKYAVDDEQYRLALNHLTSKPTLWFTLADCIASKLLTGKPPTVLKAWRFAPKGAQEGLQPIRIAGNVNYSVDPETEDFYKRLIDLRREIQQLAKAATGAERSALDHQEIAVKTVANATTYGIFIELNPEDLSKPEPGTCFGSSGSFPVETAKFEQPGTYFHPLVSVFTTGAARLMLATAERLAQESGLDWAFCDTDSMALAKPDRMSEREFLVKAQAVRDWFTPLNPYTEKGPVFKIEKENYALAAGQKTDRLKPLFCYAISPKRYALFNLERNTPIIRKAVAHGLGHLLPPLKRDHVPRSIPQPVVSLDKMDVRAWQYSLWYRILEAATSANPDHPKIDDLPGFRRPAATQYGASTPSVLAWCKGYNALRVDYRDRIKPFNFMLRFYAGLPFGGAMLHGVEKSRKRATAPKTLRPIAPYSRNPGEASRQCFDRATGEPIGSEKLSPYTKELAQYHLHPDSKFLNTEHFDRGITRRRHIVVANIRHIGKEADQLEPQLEQGIKPDAVIEYGVGGDDTLTLDQIRLELKAANLVRMRVASGISRQSLIDIRDGRGAPKRSTLRKIVAGIRRLRASESDRAKEIEFLIVFARAERDRIGLRMFAKQLGFDHSTIAQVLDGVRPPSLELLVKLDALRGQQQESL